MKRKAKVAKKKKTTYFIRDKSGQSGKKVLKAAGKFLGMSVQDFKNWYSTASMATIKDVIMSLAASVVSQAPNREKEVKKHRLSRVISDTYRPFNQRFDGSETGDFQTYVVHSKKTGKTEVGRGRLTRASPKKTERKRK